MPKKAEPPVRKDESLYSYRRPRVRTIGPDGDRRDVREASDLLRDICWGLIEDSGWTQAALAERAGVSQSSMSAFMKGEREAEGVLTGLCAVIDDDPIEVFALHPMLADHARSVIRQKDRLFQRFNMALRNDQARRFIRAIEVAKDQRKLEAAIEILSAFLGENLSLDDAGDGSETGSSARKPPKLRGVKK